MANKPCNGPCKQGDDDKAEALRIKRHQTYLEFSPNWSSGSLSKTLERYAKGVSGELSIDGVKTSYFNPQTGIRVKYDNENNYFRIYDTIRKTYLDVDGNIPKTGAMQGKDAKIYLQQRTHIKNED